MLQHLKRQQKAGFISTSHTTLQWAEGSMHFQNIYFLVWIHMRHVLPCIRVIHKISSLSKFLTCIFFSHCGALLATVFCMNLGSIVPQLSQSLYGIGHFFLNKLTNRICQLFYYGGIVHWHRLVILLFSCYWICCSVIVLLAYSKIFKVHIRIWNVKFHITKVLPWSTRTNTVEKRARLHLFPSEGWKDLAWALRSSKGSTAAPLRASLLAASPLGMETALHPTTRH
jgi:hypothetical protein